jgi:eukaryotic-like serine/threonine-protein kinase
VLGSTIAHYRIREKIGAGGMGEVYRALDTRLNRDVALKVLPTGMLTNETARTRFRREALTLSRLNHPNIAVVHDFNSENDVDFLAMEYVPGTTLASKITAGSLPEKDVIALATQIAEALEEAHGHDIIHRDLKPGNVMVTPKGRVKVLDFGMAKLVKTDADGTTVSLAESQPGAVMGTIPYMASEQLQGKQVDGRTDIYALGALMYEMATGHRPFPERQTSQLIAAILTKTPPMPRDLNAHISPGLQAIILKALEKDPEHRYQSAKEILNDLDRVSVPGAIVGASQRTSSKRWVLAAMGVAVLVLAFASLVGLNVGNLRDRLIAGNSVPRIQSLAVLPLENLSGDPQQEYFADGMTDQLITDLAKVSALKVISRTSMMQYKDTKKSLPEIAKELHVDAVIEGSVLREGDRVRVTAQLINPQTDQDLWADSYERDLRSVLTLQGEIARAVVSKVRVALTPDERSHLVSTEQVNPDAYDAYLKGKFFLNRMTPEGFEKGLTYMQKAVELDPTNPLPYTGLAVAYSQIGHERAPEMFTKAKAAAAKAEELGGSSAEMYLALGQIKLESEWDFVGAEKDLRRAIELNPSIGAAHDTYSWYLVMHQEPDKALVEVQRAQDVEPLTPLFPADMAFQLWTVGQFDKAIEKSRESLELQPNFTLALAVLGDAYASKGMFAEAIATHKKLAAIDPVWRWLLPYTYAVAGQPDEARKTLAKFLQEKPKATGAWAGWFLAGTYGVLGDKNEAFSWLEKSYQARQSFFPWIRTDPIFQSLRSDPRFQEFVRRMNFPQ